MRTFPNLVSRETIWNPYIGKYKYLGTNLNLVVLWADYPPFPQISLKTHYLSRLFAQREAFPLFLVSEYYTKGFWQFGSH